MKRPLPSHADVVVVGAGMLGSSTAFHLRELGSEVLVLERGALTSEASSQGAGFLCSIRPKVSSAQIVRYSTEFYRDFHQRTGYDIDLHLTGGIRVALGRDWLTSLRGEAETGRSIGIETDELSPAELSERVPGFDLRDAVGGIFTPLEGYVTATREAAIGMARGAARNGADLRTYEEVSAITLAAGGSWDVMTSSGRVRAQSVVLAANAGIWPLLRRAGLALGAYVVHHQLGVYDLPKGVDASLPTVRIGERDLYLRHEVGGLMIGGVGDNPGSPSVRAPDEAFLLANVLPERTGLDEMVERAAPFVAGIDGAATIREQRGLCMVAPDLEPMLGEIAPRLYVATADLRGIQSGPGLGRMLAQLVATGESEWDAAPYRPDRFADLARDPEAVRLAAIRGLRPSLYDAVPAN